MLPKAQGGVVDANLKVYGLCKSIFIHRPVLRTPVDISFTANVRVVDSSIFPVSFTAHVSHSTLYWVPFPNFFGIIAHGSHIRAR